MLAEKDGHEDDRRRSRGESSAQLPQVGEAQLDIEAESCNTEDRTRRSALRTCAQELA